ncbi:hypothetical protein H2198_005244 [Neophaeococcomyces mojaviensis]|uniref:Uncharacterized protein n=1 Tax=Neophaeococcomyces mojaviensis TaxID=3383035 RepID=A0ACC3A637_9EURO|nr:hypothetical protein H2198_005244 [Knufia sp. JES_112]
MADVSPTSVKSQLLNDDNENENDFVSGFISQLPFTTQIPHATKSYPSRQQTPKPKQIRTPHILEDLRNPPAATLEVLDQAQRHVYALLSSEKREAASHVLDPEAEIDKSHASPHNADAEGSTSTGKVLAPSSNESLECQPLQLPTEDNTPSQSQGIVKVGHYNMQISKEGQPFPLVDWIRTIRAETGKKQSALPLRWARSIPKAQRAILDADDAWMPPLPGRLQRQGTVPIDILNILTIRADRDVGVRENQEHNVEEKRSRLAAPNVVENVAVISSPAALPLSSASDEDSNVEPDNETVGPIDWPSSPPGHRRPRLPPDTSPPPQADRHTSYPLQNMQEKMLDATGDQSCSTHSQTDRVQSHYKSPKTREVAQQEDEDSMSELRVDIQPASLHVEIVHVAQSQKESDHARDEPAHTTRRILHPPSKTQVKETPYPSKDNPALQKHKVLSNNAPQSSFVLATFPEGTRAQTQPRKLHQPRSDLPQKAQHAANLSSSSPRERRYRQASQRYSLPNQSLTEDMSPRVDAVSYSQPVSAIRQQLRSRPSQNHRDLERMADVAMPSTRKRLWKESEDVGDHPIAQGDPDYRELDEQRKRARREFYRTHSKHQTDKNPEPAPKFIDTRSSSMGSSPPLNKRQSLRYDSEGHTTSQISTSIHDSVLDNTPSSKPSQRSSLQIDQGDPHLASLFTKFKLLYPTYRGSEKSFLSALQLLWRLRVQCREPHSFLWDDFIYRLAHDYKTYLQNCIEQDKSAVPYEMYYHRQVPKPEYLLGCVNADVLHELISHHRSLKRLLTSNTSHTIVQTEPSCAEKNGAGRGADAALSQVTPLSSSVAPAATIQETPASQGHLQAKAQSMQAPAIALRREKSLSQQIVNSKNAELKRKRRSLPWSTTTSNMARTNPIMKQSVLATSNVHALKPTPEPSAKVEKWLVRAPGGESPELLPQGPSAPFRAESLELLPEEEPPTPPLSSNNNVATLDSDRSNTGVASNHTIKTPTLRLPAYLTMPANSIMKSIESSPLRLPPSTALLSTSELGKSVRKRMRRSELPVTLFTMFGRNYGDLPEEKKRRAIPRNANNGGINIYNW